jgi:hypothetical protein
VKHRVGETVIYQAEPWLVIGIHSDGKGGRMLILQRGDREVTVSEKKVTGG